MYADTEGARPSFTARCAAATCALGKLIAILTRAVSEVASTH